MGISTIEADITLIKLPDSSEIFASDGTVNRFGIGVEIDLAKYLDDFLQPMHLCSNSKINFISSIQCIINNRSHLLVLLKLFSGSKVHSRS
jgi:hypothetical protein